MKKKRIEIISRDLALDILKAYHREIKSGFIADVSAAEREKAQAAAFKAAEVCIYKMIDEHGGTDALCIEDPSSLNQMIEDDQ